MSILKKIWYDQIFINIFSGVIIMVLGYLFVTSDEVKTELHEFIYPIVAPDLVTYDTDFRQDLLKEVESGACEAHVELAKDYLLMREQHIFITNPENWK